MTNNTPNLNDPDFDQTITQTQKNTFFTRYTSRQLFIGAWLAPLVLGALVGGVVFAKSTAIKPEENHILGNKNAPIKLVEYSDFQCPFCQRALPTLKRILDEYGDKVSLEYRHFPLDFHPYAQKAAEASECAAEQGKFWQFHDKAFEKQANLSGEALKQWAKEIKLNMRNFSNCLDTGKYASKVQAQYQEGQAKGVQGTPATFINGQLVSGAQPFEAFKQVIDSLVK